AEIVGGVATRLAAGVAHVPADRASVGLVRDMTIADNVVLRDVDRPPFCRRGWLDRDAAREAARRGIEAFDIRAEGVDVPVRTLSGGNQQKVILARELGRGPRVLLAVQPTRGLDPGATRFVIDRVRALRDGGAARPLASAVLGIAVALGTAALLVLLSGRNPVVAYLALLGGAVGTPDRVAVALNKATPYLLTGAGVALCFRARIVNIGAEGQIALGGLAATWLALRLPQAPAVVLPVLCALAGAGAGAVWGGLAALVRLKRRVHEVLVTLLLNFVGVLIVGEVLHGELGEPGAGFPQSPLLPAAGWLPRL